jgi:hypothetical protein
VSRQSFTYVHSLPAMKGTDNGITPPDGRDPGSDCI